MDLYLKGKRVLLRSVGLEPAALSERAQLVALVRMVPFVERNYNMVELGPRGTGKSHLYQQISPYAHLISGGKATGGEDVRQQRQWPAWLNSVDPQAWPTDVLGRIADHKITRLDELMPWRYAQY